MLFKGERAVSGMLRLNSRNRSCVQDRFKRGQMLGECLAAFRSSVDIRLRLAGNKRFCNSDVLRVFQLAQVRAQVAVSSSKLITHVPETPLRVGIESGQGRHDLQALWLVDQFVKPGH